MKSWSTTGHLPVANGNIFTHLDKAKVPFRIYGDDNFPMAGVMEGVHSTNTFDVHNHPTSISSLQTALKDATNDKPFPYNFVWIEPDYDVMSSMATLHKHPMYSTGNSMHPCSDVRKAEQLIADLYNWIAGNPSVWQNCVFIITWDEHGGFYDHVLSPTATPPGDSPAIGRTWSFKFDRLGTRVPCLVISPFIESNLIDSRQYDHGSILKTVIDLYNKGAFSKGAAPATQMQPWTNRIGAAASMIDLFTADVAKAQTVALGTPLEPADIPALQVAEQPPASQDKPSGNTPIFLAAAMNLHQSADPSVNLPETAAGLTSNAAAADYFNEAAAAVDDAQSQAA
jgi:phospholipase C